MACLSFSRLDCALPRSRTVCAAARPVFADGHAPAANADPGLVTAASISLLCLFGGTPPLAEEMGIPDKGPSPARPCFARLFARRLFARLGFGMITAT